MSMTAGPHLPKKGWFTRWSKQAVALVFRSPEAVVATAGLSFIVAILTMVLTLSQEAIGLSREMTLTISGLVLTPVFLAASAIIMNRIMIADLGKGWSMSEAVGVTKTLLPRVMYYALMLAIFSVVLDVLLPSPAEVANSTTGDASSSEARGDASLQFNPGGWAGLFIVMLQVGGAEILSIFLPLALLHPFALSAVMGGAMGEREVRHNDAMLKVKSFSVHTQLFFAVIFLPLAGILFPGIFAIFFTPFAIAWMYVGGREVVGGIDSNGKVEEQKSFKTASAGSF